MTIHNKGMSTHYPGPLEPADLAILADKITALSPGAVEERQYVAGYRHGVIDANAEVMAVYHRASAAAYAAAVDAESPEASADDLADVARELLGLAVRLGMADQDEIESRAAALKGGDRG